MTSPMAGRVAPMELDDPARELEEPARALSLASILRSSENRHALFSGIITLTLSIMGGAVLPLPLAFTLTGVACGFVIMLVVALANVYTCDLLLRQAHHTGAVDYESLALTIGGKWWKLATEISIVVLLIGTIIGGIQQVGESAASGLVRIPSHVPHWLTGGSGRIMTLVFVVFIVAPCCLVVRMRQLELVATVGTSIVLWLLMVIVVDSIGAKLPALKTGQLSTTGFSDIGSIAQAVSTFGFAFYIQPMMMPFLAEMPSGYIGVKLTSYSIRTVILGTSFCIYAAIGFFGAARYGRDAAGNILENKWLGGGVAQVVLNLAMSVYLSFAIPTVEFPTRHTLNNWVPGSKEERPWLRHLAISACILVLCTGISLIWPNKSSTVVTVTGATGVCMVSYLVPIVNHLLLFFRRGKCQKSDNPCLSSGVQYRRKRKNNGVWGLLGEYSVEVLLPLLVTALGLFSSVAALSTL